MRPDGPSYFRGALSSGWVEGAILAALILYLREVTQVQSKNKWRRYYETTDDKGMDFSEGWLLDLHHNAEWIVPGLLTLAAAWAIEST